MATDPLRIIILTNFELDTEIQPVAFPPEFWPSGPSCKCKPCLYVPFVKAKRGATC